jgi:hypothetical protein
MLVLWNKSCQVVEKPVENSQIICVKPGKKLLAVDLSTGFSRVINIVFHRACGKLRRIKM